MRLRTCALHVRVSFCVTASAGNDAPSTTQPAGAAARSSSAFSKAPTTTLIAVR